MSEQGQQQSSGNEGGQQQGQQQQQSPWYVARGDTDFTGTIENRGLKGKDAAETAFEFYKAHKEAQGLISRVTGTADKDRILVMPKPDSPEAERNAFWEKMGRPSKADDYDFKDVKFGNGDALDDTFAGWLRGTAFKLNLSKDGAVEWAKEQVAYLDGVQTAENAANAANLAAEKAAFQRSIGPNWETFKFVAGKGAQHAKLDADAVNKIESALGYTKTMQLMNMIGSMTGEDKFVAGTAPGGTGAMSKAQASARLTELKQDAGWTKRFFDGDLNAKKEFEALTQLMAA